MSTPGVVLHLRARGVGWALGGAVSVTVLAWVAARWLAEHPHLSGPDARVPVIALAPALLAMVCARTLGGSDERLESTTPAPWRRWRTIHLAVALVVAGAALVGTVTDDPWGFGAVAIARNTLGCLGLVALATVVVGSRLAWAPLLTYLLTVYLAAPRQPGPVAAALAWPMQRGTSTNAAISAVLIAVIGAGAYRARGARVSDDT